MHTRIQTLTDTLIHTHSYAQTHTHIHTHTHTHMVFKGFVNFVDRKIIPSPFTSCSLVCTFVTDLIDNEGIS